MSKSELEQQIATVLALIEDHAPDVMLMEGHDNALLGYVDRFGSEPVACYDYRVVTDLCDWADTFSKHRVW